jgi:radical SAM superfamily enzyme YgiQ (UPF0313 family)
MNILVINPPNSPFTNNSILAEPLDVLLIATIINKKYDNVRVIDMDVNRMVNNINSYLMDNNIIIFVFDYQLPLHTTDTINNIFSIIKNVNRNSKFIIIGKTSTYYYKKFIDNGVDIIIKGIAEDIINDVIDSINDTNKLNCIPNIVFKSNNNLIDTGILNIHNNYSSLPTINRSFLDISKYMDTRTIITSRGCNGTCKFCTTPYFFKGFSARNPIDVVLEIEELISKYNTNKIIFLDDNLCVDRERILEICNLIKTRNIKCLFGCLCSIKNYDKDLFIKMYEVGFRWVHFGIESGSRRILKLMNKEMDINNIKNIINEVKEMGYRVRTSFILDYPTSTKEDIIKTKELILSIKPHEVRLHYLAYRVGTPLFYENKDLSNKTQYIHNNKPNVENNLLIEEINNLIEELKNNNYNLVFNDIDWNKYNNLSKDTKIAAFTPIKYGMCWYE